jgi:hypothetical protein
MQIQDEGLPQIGLGLSLGKSIYRAPDPLQGRDFAVMFKNEVGRPALCLHVEVHRQ